MKYLLIIILICFSACDTFDAGTLGAFQQWCFPVSQSKMAQGLTNLLVKNPSYKIPEKWKYLDNWSERGYESLEGQIIYFKKQPEEMYYISYFSMYPQSIGNDTDSNITKLAIRSVNNGGIKWYGIDDLVKDSSEVNRINKRFYVEIILKLEKQMNVEVKKDESDL
ncbi:hypothetical protein [uncultured Fibrella sp.]|uniref:hypothetical protein n=1 Tax=uncultured Fibrella sp. TaxID=1284596 RepID=UPI0035CBCA71